MSAAAAGKSRPNLLVPSFTHSNSRLCHSGPAALPSLDDGFSSDFLLSLEKAESLLAYLPDVDVDESTPRVLPNSTQAQGLSHNLCCNALTLFAL